MCVKTDCRKYDVMFISRARGTQWAKGSGRQRVVAPASWSIVRLSKLEKKARRTCASLGKGFKAIDAALDEGQKEPWPKSFNERLVVGLLLSELFTLSAENLLLELDGEKMDIVESICRQGGRSGPAS
jgi:hypothetical protein